MARVAVAAFCFGLMIRLDPTEAQSFKWLFWTGGTKSENDTRTSLKPEQRDESDETQMDITKTVIPRYQ